MKIEKYALDIKVTGLKEMREKVMELQKALEKAESLVDELTSSKVTITAGESGLLVRNLDK